MTIVKDISILAAAARSEHQRIRSVSEYQDRQHDRHNEECITVHFYSSDIMLPWPPSQSDVAWTNARSRLDDARTRIDHRPSPIHIAPLLAKRILMLDEAADAVND